MEIAPEQRPAIRLRPLDEVQALDWLRRQGEVSLSAAELGKNWLWHPDRVRRHLKKWSASGLIHRQGRVVSFLGKPPDPNTEPATSLEDSGGTTSPSGFAPSPVSHTVPQISIVNVAVLFAALTLAAVSGSFAIYGLTAIFAGAFWPVIAMGATLEAGKLSAVAWLGENWRSAPRALAIALLGAISVLMSVNAVGAYGFLTRAHVERLIASELGLSDRAADLGARINVQSHVVASIDRQLTQIDAAVEEATRRGHSIGAMRIAEEQRRSRADLSLARQREARALAHLQVEDAQINTERQRAAADVGPLRYLAELMGSGADLEHATRLLTVAVVLVLDPLAVLLLIAATFTRTTGHSGPSSR